MKNSTIQAMMESVKHNCNVVSYKSAKKSILFLFLSRQSIKPSALKGKYAIQVVTIKGFVLEEKKTNKNRGYSCLISRSFVLFFCDVVFAVILLTLFHCVQYSRAYS